jgi:hypothetical protein
VHLKNFAAMPPPPPPPLLPSPRLLSDANSAAVNGR